MPDPNEELLFNNSLCGRVKSLRTERGWTADQMATALGVPADRYRKYETRSPLPAYLMPRFCLLAQCEFDYLLTGKRARRAVPPLREQRRVS